MQMMDNRDGKRGGLSSTGLGRTNEVAAVKNDWDCLLLDWCWVSITLFGDGRQDAF
jgi:hypothetical protein